MKDIPLDTLQYDKLSASYNFFNYAENRIKYAIFETNQELYILRNYPSIFYNSKKAYIGGDFRYQYKNEMIICKSVYSDTDEIDYFATYTNDRNSLADQRKLLNILAYFNS